MRHFLFIGALASAACMAGAPALAQPATTGPMVSRGGPLMATGPMVSPRGPVMRGPSAPNWGSRVDGRWWAGYQAPGGWGGYRAPTPGFILPGYWLQPSYYIGDYGAYGLPAPQPGYGWSRYYDDAVLTDRYGRVSDSRPGYDWDHYGYDARYQGADDYDRWARAGADRKIAKEEMKQRRKLDKLARKAGYANYGDYLRARAPRGPRPGEGPMGPHWAMQGGPEHGGPGHGGSPGAYAAGTRVETRQMPGYAAGGYYYPGAIVTTVTIPAQVSTVTTTRVVTQRTTHSTVTRRPARLRPATKLLRR